MAAIPSANVNLRQINRENRQIVYMTLPTHPNPGYILIMYESYYCYDIHNEIVYFRIIGITQNMAGQVSRLLIRPYDIVTHEILADTHIALEPPFDTPYDWRTIRRDIDRSPAVAPARAAGGKRNTKRRNKSKKSRNRNRNRRSR